MLKEFELRSAAVDQKKLKHLELKEHVQTISGNALFFIFLMLSLPKETYLHMTYPIATHPANNALKKRNSSNNCFCHYTASTSTEKVLSFPG